MEEESSERFGELSRVTEQGSDRADADPKALTVASNPGTLSPGCTVKGLMRGL